jgi:hypothetical protein
MGEQGLVNILGGCCGSTPRTSRDRQGGEGHRAPPRSPAAPARTRLAGLEPMTSLPEPFLALRSRARRKPRVTEKNLDADQVRN